MSGVEPPIRFIDPNRKKTLFIKNTDNLEVESASDGSITPPKKQPKVQESKPAKQIIYPPRNMEGLEYLLNAAKQREDLPQSECSVDDADEEDEYHRQQEDVQTDIGSYPAENPHYNTRQQAPQVNNNPHDKENKRNRKQEMLAKLMGLKAKGVELTRHYDINSSYSDIEFEYNTQKKAMDAEGSIKFQRQFLVAAITGLEYLNKRFDPIGAKLNGWSESVIGDIDSYDEVFRKLYEKYSSRAELPPEVELLVLLVGSAFMFHMTNSIMESAMGSLNKTIVESSVKDNISTAIRSTKGRTNESEMSGPSVNLSSMLSGGIGPMFPVSNEPLKKLNDDILPNIANDDMFSMVSSDTNASITKKKGAKGNNKPKRNAIKTINI